jgi:putative SOS response-associated peptidase YedK
MTGKLPRHRRLVICNDYRLKVDVEAIRQDFSGLKIRIGFPDGVPNLASRHDIRITDTAPIVRAAAEAGSADVVQRRWSWPGPGGKPVYNFRSDGREFSSGRCLIPADGFYEFTTPGDPGKKRKDKWLFTKAGEPWFCVAGLWRAIGDGAEAFTMLTTEPGPDVAPYHNRQIAVLERSAWSAWLNPTVPARELLRPCSAGSLQVEQVG